MLKEKRSFSNFELLLVSVLSTIFGLLIIAKLMDIDLFPYETLFVIILLIVLSIYAFQRIYAKTSTSIILGTLLGIAFMILLSPNTISFFFGDVRIMNALAVTFIVIIIGKTGEFYLNESKKVLSTNNEYKKEFEFLKNENRNLTNRENLSAVYTENEKNNLKKEIKEFLKSDISIETIRDFEEKIENNIKNRNQLNLIKQQLNQTSNRLQQEIFDLSKRGNLNLVIGIGTTIAAISILAYTVLQPTVFTKETIISEFIPKLTLTIFIEIFSFFFLRLYKTSLSEIKYYQNELTNVELKFLALNHAIEVKESEVLNEILNNFSKTERNFILDKGQTTIELEQNKFDINAINSIIKSLKLEQTNNINKRD